MLISSIVKPVSAKIKFSSRPNAGVYAQFINMYAISLNDACTFAWSTIDGQA
jgi:hypothetical protein